MSRARKREQRQVEFRARQRLLDAPPGAGGSPPRRRLRVGDYRVIYTIDNGELVVCSGTGPARDR
ncbi:type II toxin-antitoxin system RelE/ParE family toxin [Streptomyces sp. NPDC050315]|uniref:type II toxin-antitoxin system RelE family toxin n=1 Tax=Streptomyces sp. NPDC050315 TaxID=3155039 RepID=UPI003440EF39